MKKILIVLMILLSSQSVSYAQQGNIIVSGEWARPILVAGRPGGAYLKIQNNGSDNDTLLSATSPISPRVELHEHTMADGVMKMRQVMGIEVPAGGMVELKPGGYHIMLFDTDNTYGPGDKIDLELNFKNAGKIKKTLEILAKQP